MPDFDQPQLYLATPDSFSLSEFPDMLAQVLDAAPIACLRIDLASRDEDTLSRGSDTVRELAHQRDVAVVIRDHVVLAERLGLDGVHLTDAHKSVRDARKTLGPDAIVGCFCGTSRHDGMTAGEAGADYISFGPVGPTALGDGAHADLDLFAWWSEMIELPVVAEGAIDQQAIQSLMPVTDFLCLGPEVWSAPDPAAMIKSVASALQG